MQTIAFIGRDPTFRQAVSELAARHKSSNILLIQENDAAAFVERIISECYRPDSILVHFLHDHDHERISSFSCISGRCPGVSVTFLSGNISNEYLEQLVLIPQPAKDDTERQAPPRYSHVSRITIVKRKTQHTTQATITQLTYREMDFLRLCASELTYKEIASEMNISLSTVNNYRDSLFIKLGIKNRVGLVLFAINSFIINPFQ